MDARGTQMSTFIPFFTGSGSGSGGMTLHHTDASAVESFPPHFLSLSLAPHVQQQTPHSHMLGNVAPSVTVTPVGLSTQSSNNMPHALKGIILPTQPLPPEQVMALSENQLLGNVVIKQEEVKPKKVKSENQSEPTFVKCEYCEYCCDKKDRLSRHVRIVHFKERPFACNLCEYSTGRKDKLKRHQSTVHSQERPFKCDFCAHTSSRKDKLREHIQGVHYKNRPKRPKKKYPKKKKNPPGVQMVEQLQQQQQQQQQTQQQHVHPHQIIVSQTQNNGVHVLTTTSAGLTMTQLPVSLVPVSVSASGLPTHYQIKHHQPHHVNLLS